MKVVKFTMLLVIMLSFLTLRGTFAQSATNQFSEGDQIDFMHHDEQAVQEPSNSSLVLKSTGAVLIICGLIFGVAWGMKKLGFISVADKKESDRIELALLSSLNMGGGKTVSAIQFGGKTLLVGITAQNFTLLAEESAVVSSGRSVRELLADDEDYAFESILSDAERKMFDRGGEA